MSRTICLIIYNAPLFPAHWALWVPSPDIPTIGKRLHASGDAATGFQIVFERNYDISSETRRHQVLRLDQVSDYYVVDVKGYGNLIEDQTAHDDLERVVLSVPAPAQSLVAVTSQVCDFHEDVPTDANCYRNQESG